MLWMWALRRNASGGPKTRVSRRVDSMLSAATCPPPTNLIARAAKIYPVNLFRWLRPTILDRYVAREIWPPTALGLLLFTFILLLDQISSLMKVLVSRGADLATVARAFAFLLPSIFSVTIPMAFLMGVLLAFGRLASDSEIVALRASGISPARLLRPVVALSLATGLLTFYIVAVALPVANQAYREIIFALIVSKARTGVTPRVFNDDLIPGGNMVLYVSDIPADTGEWQDIFIYDTKNPQQPRAILARAGRLDIDRDRAEGRARPRATASSTPSTPPRRSRSTRTASPPGSSPSPTTSSFPRSRWPRATGR